MRIVTKPQRFVRFEVEFSIKEEQKLYRRYGHCYWMSMRFVPGPGKRRVVTIEVPEDAWPIRVGSKRSSREGARCAASRKRRSRTTSAARP